MGEYVLMRNSSFRKDPLYVWEVEQWQKFLVSRGKKLGASGVDGNFGRKTEAATLAFQREAGLTPDGKVGKRTWTRAEAMGSGDASGGASGAGAPPPTRPPERIGDVDLLPIRHSADLSAEFKQKVVQIGNDLKIDPNFLMAVMAFESRLDPKAQNPGSTATGLIQFMKSTAEDLGTSTAALLRMSGVRQLDFVNAYFQKRIKERGPLKTIEDTYMAVLFPVLVGKSNNAVFAANGGSSSSRRRYRVNSGLDINGDGIITKEEASTKVRRILEEAKRKAGVSGAPAPGEPGPTTTNPGLRRGSPRGREVREVQELLVALGHMTQAHMNTGVGIFGPRTEQAVERFQHDVELDPTGVVDAQTHAQLKAAVDALPEGERVDPKAITTLVPAEGDGYVTYGPPHKKYTRIGVFRALERLARLWKERHPDHVLQIGNISKLGGGRLSPHKSHLHGLDVDFRPIRKDGRIQGVTIDDGTNYDSARTAELVDLLRSEFSVVKILFNDPKLVPHKTKKIEGHHNHLHVTFPG